MEGQRGLNVKVLTVVTCLSRSCEQQTGVCDQETRIRVCFKNVQKDFFLFI